MPALAKLDSAIELSALGQGLSLLLTMAQCIIGYFSKAGLKVVCNRQDLSNDDSGGNEVTLITSFNGPSSLLKTGHEPQSKAVNNKNTAAALDEILS